jgi:hypothetical protein
LKEMQLLLLSLCMMSCRDFVHASKGLDVSRPEDTAKNSKKTSTTPENKEITQGKKAAESTSGTSSATVKPKSEPVEAKTSGQSGTSQASVPLGELGEQGQNTFESTTSSKSQPTSGQEQPTLFLDPAEKTNAKNDANSKEKEADASLNNALKDGQDFLNEQPEDTNRNDLEGNLRADLKDRGYTDEQINQVVKILDKSRAFQELLVNKLKADPKIKDLEIPDPSDPTAVKAYAKKIVDVTMEMLEKELKERGNKSTEEIVKKALDRYREEYNNPKFRKQLIEKAETVIKEIIEKAKNADVSKPLNSSISGMILDAVSAVVVGVVLVFVAVILGGEASLGEASLGVGSGGKSEPTSKLTYQDREYKNSKDDLFVSRGNNFKLIPN